MNDARDPTAPVSTVTEGTPEFARLAPQCGVRVCEVEGCHRVHHARGRGLCQAHYRQEARRQARRAAATAAG